MSSKIGLDVSASTVVTGVGQAVVQVYGDTLRMLCGLPIPSV
jgi:hypothetical protein